MEKIMKNWKYSTKLDRNCVQSLNDADSWYQLCAWENFKRQI